MKNVTRSLSLMLHLKSWIKSECTICFSDQFMVLLPYCIAVIIAEMLVDWTKHAFITRFNEINFEVRILFYYKTKRNYLLRIEN